MNASSQMLKPEPRILVLQHLAVEHPGIFREYLGTDNIAWDVVELDEGETIPELRDYTGLWVMGGPMDVWELGEYPWLETEIATIRHAVCNLKMPYLGLCLGHQLLAMALGGEVAKGESEVGIMPVELSRAGRANAYFDGLPTTLDCLQWHSAEVKQIGYDVTVLARSEACAVQAMTVGSHALSAQFHVEVTRDTVPEWSVIPAYAQALEAALGDGAVERFQNDVERSIGALNANAKIFYDNWMHVTGFKARAGSAEKVSQ